MEKGFSALRAESVSKSFGDNAVLDDFHVEIPAASAHALVGMNGSGKSTFVKILAGFYQRDTGTDPVGEHVLDRTEVELALPCPVFGDVTEPQPI